MCELEFALVALIGGGRFFSYTIMEPEDGKAEAQLGICLFPFLFNCVRLHTHLATILLVETFYFWLRAKIQHCWCVGFCQLKKVTPDTFVLIFRKNKQFCDGPEIITI